MNNAQQLQSDQYLSRIGFDSNTSVVNRRTEKETLYIGRGSIWGNPFTAIHDKKTKAEFVVETRQQSIEGYKQYLLRSPALLFRLLELNGHKLGCFCKPQSCHGDILVWALKGMLRMMRDYRVPDGVLDWTDPARIEQLVWYSDLVSGAELLTEEQDARMVVCPLF
jgi:hypothetical protein